MNPIARVHWRCKALQAGWLVAALLVAGCTAAPVTRYHQLTPLSPHSPNTTMDRELVVDTVRLPESLERLAFVVRLDANQVEVLDTERWVSPLSDQLTRSWIDSLQSALGDTWVRSRYAPPRVGVAPYGLSLEVEQLDMTYQGDVQLRVHWALVDHQARVLRQGRTRVQTQAQQPGWLGLAPAVSEAVAQAACEMAPLLRQEWAANSPAAPLSDPANNCR